MRRVQDDFVPKIDKFCTLSDKRVLEIGCSTGKHSLQLAGICKHLVAADPDNANVLAAGQAADEKEVSNAEFITMHARDMRRLGGKRFDLVLFNWMLHQLAPTEMKKAIDEAVEHTNPGAFIIFVEPKERGIFHDVVLRFDGFDGYKHQAHCAIYDHQRLKAIATVSDLIMFEFTGKDDFVRALRPGRTDKLEAYLIKSGKRFVAERRIDICALRPAPVPAFLSTR